MRRSRMSLSVEEGEAGGGTGSVEENVTENRDESDEGDGEVGDGNYGAITTHLCSKNEPPTYAESTLVAFAVREDT